MTRGTWNMPWTCTNSMLQHTHRGKKSSTRDRGWMRIHDDIPSIQQYCLINQICLIMFLKTKCINTHFMGNTKRTQEWRGLQSTYVYYTWIQITHSHSYVQLFWFSTKRPKKGAYFGLLKFNCSYKLNTQSITKH